MTGRKQKYDYRSSEFLEKVEGLAKKGLTDSEIAFSVGLNPTVFSEKKNSITEISEALARARKTINSIVRQKYLSVGLGGLKTKTVTRRKTELPEGEVSDYETVTEVESELPPNPQVLQTWLFNHDEEWRRAVMEGKRMDLANRNTSPISFPQGSSPPPPLVSNSPPLTPSS